MSTNKVYGDNPNYLPLIEKKTRWEIKKSHKYFMGSMKQCQLIIAHIVSLVHQNLMLI